MTNLARTAPPPPAGRVPPAGAAVGRRAALVVPLAVPGALLPGAGASSAQETSLDLLLVLALDASGSIDADEFRFQREGCAEALTHPAVLSAVASKPRGAIAVAIVEWGSPGGAETAVGWHRVDGPATAALLARAVIDAPRSRQSWNAIGDALDHAARLIASAPWRADERVIDVSGDAADMRGLRPVEDARHDAAEAGIVVNALAIAGGRAGLVETYERTVIAGPGAFVVGAESRGDFARAMRAKLVREIA